MTKKIEPTDAYLVSLYRDLDSTNERFDRAKAALYRVTATAKLGESDFEMARKACLDALKDQEKIEVEIDRVKRALKK